MVWGSSKLGEDDETAETTHLEKIWKLDRLKNRLVDISFDWVLFVVLLLLAIAVEACRISVCGTGGGGGGWCVSLVDGWLFRSKN